MSPNVTAADQAKITRPRLADLDIPVGKRVRLHRLLYEHGLKNGTLLVLPIDQGIEHGPLNFFPNPASKDPEYQWRLAAEGGYNAIACHWGMAVRYMKKYAGRVPLILKINGKTNIPSDAEAFSPLTATVEDAVAIGADAIGYTLYVVAAAGRLPAVPAVVRRRSTRCRSSLVVSTWLGDRGRGGRGWLHAVDYAARRRAGRRHQLTSKSEGTAAEAVQRAGWTYEEACVVVGGSSMVLFAGAKISDRS